jgi:hypothetical protein
MEPVAPLQPPAPPQPPIEPTLSQAAQAGPIDATNDGALKQIRTFQGDMAEAIRHEQASLVSIRAAERAKRDIIRDNEMPEEKAAKRSRMVTLGLLLGGLVFIAGAGYAGWYAYHTYLAKTAVPVVTVPKNRFLPVVATENVDATGLSRAGIISLLQSERGKSINTGSIIHSEFLKGGADTSPLEGTTEFLISLEGKAPSNLVRAFSQLFMVGTLGEATDTTPNDTFLLIKLDSFENSYAGMLEWEKSLKEDLLPLFQNADTVSNMPNDAVFEDITLKNKDARALYDTSGKIVLVYSFYNQNLLIITGSETGLRTLLAELDTQALKR